MIIIKPFAYNMIGVFVLRRLKVKAKGKKVFIAEVGMPNAELILYMVIFSNLSPFTFRP